MIELIKKAIEEAKKHHIHHYVIVCNIEDYPEVKTICKNKFPQIRVIWASAVSKGKIYLWDEPEKAMDVIQKKLTCVFLNAGLCLLEMIRLGG